MVDFIVVFIRLALNLTQTAILGLLFYWSFNTVADFPWENWLRREVRFYHLLLPSLALAGLASGPVNAIWERLSSFFSLFSPDWLSALANLAGGLGLLSLLVWLVKTSPQQPS